jgi:hypothetical protein
MELRCREPIDAGNIGGGSGLNITLNAELTSSPDREVNQIRQSLPEFQRGACRLHLSPASVVQFRARRPFASPNRNVSPNRNW